MPEKTLSVVLPNYNHARYLAGALEAICSQSLKPSEVVVVDDASTDGSVAVIEGFARRYPFLRLLRNPRNMGVMPSLRRGFAEVRGDYVFFPAADDRVFPGLFEKSMRLLARHPGAGLCSALCRLLGPDDEDLGPFETPLVSEAECFVPPERYVETYKRHGNWIMSVTAILRRDAVAEMGGHQAEIGPPADAVLVREVAMKYGACFLPEPLAAWRPPVSGGYGQKVSESLQNLLDIQDRIERRLLHPPGREPTPDELEYARVWKKRDILANIQHLMERTPPAYPEIAAFLERIAEPTAWERALAAFVRRSPWRPRLPLKLYHFLQQTGGEKRRILRRKLGRLLRL